MCVFFWFFCFCFVFVLFCMHVDMCKFPIFVRLFSFIVDCFPSKFFVLSHTLLLISVLPIHLWFLDLGNENYPRPPRLYDCETHTDVIGILTSPNYPSNYPNNLHCEYTINQPEKTTIALRWEDFHLEDCYYDYIKVRIDLQVYINWEMICVSVLVFMCSWYSRQALHCAACSFMPTLKRGWLSARVVFEKICIWKHRHKCIFIDRCTGWCQRDTGVKRLCDLKLKVPFEQFEHFSVLRIISVIFIWSVWLILILILILHGIDLRCTVCCIS